MTFAEWALPVEWDAGGASVLTEGSDAGRRPGHTARPCLSTGLRLSSAPPARGSADTWLWKSLGPCAFALLAHCCSSGPSSEASEGGEEGREGSRGRVCGGASLPTCPWPALPKCTSRRRGGRGAVTRVPLTPERTVKPARAWAAPGSILLWFRGRQASTGAPRPHQGWTRVFLTAGHQHHVRHHRCHVDSEQGFREASKLVLIDPLSLKSARGSHGR